MRCSEYLQLFILEMPLSGPVMSIPTAIMLKIWTPEPDMYSMIAFIGNDLAGEYASSHALAILSAAGSARCCATAVEDFDLDCFCKRIRCQRGTMYEQVRSNISLRVQAMVTYLADSICIREADWVRQV